MFVTWLNIYTNILHVCEKARTDYMTSIKLFLLRFLYVVFGLCIKLKDDSTCISCEAGYVKKKNKEICYDCKCVNYQPVTTRR